MVIRSVYSSTRADPHVSTHMGGIDGLEDGRVILFGHPGDIVAGSSGVRRSRWVGSCLCHESELRWDAE
jgi:hypothetical protein